MTMKQLKTLCAFLYILSKGETTRFYNIWQTAKEWGDL